MSVRNQRRVSCLAAVACLLWCASGSAVADVGPTNGDFSTPNLAGWSVASGNVFDGGGVAVLQEHTLDLLSSLTQVFTLPAGVQMLSFDLQMSATPGGNDFLMPPDGFFATLYDNPVDLNPLLSIPGYTEFFYLDNTGFADDSVAGYDGTTVTLDVSSLAGRDVWLVFDLLGSDDGMITEATLDNISVSVVPLPGAVILGLLGFGGGIMGLRRVRSHLS